MLKFSEIFEFFKGNSYFERIRMVRMVRMVRSLADRTFQLWCVHVDVALGLRRGRHDVHAGLRVGRVPGGRQGGLEVRDFREVEGRFRPTSSGERDTEKS